MITHEEAGNGQERRSVSVGQQTFQMLVCIPAGKLVPDPVDEIDQDFGGLVQVFHTVPISHWCASTVFGINLQKPDQQRMKVKLFLGDTTKAAALGPTCISPKALWALSQPPNS